MSSGSSDHHIGGESKFFKRPYSSDDELDSALWKVMDPNHIPCHHKCDKTKCKHQCCKVGVSAKTAKRKQQKIDGYLVPKSKMVTPQPTPQKMLPDDMLLADLEGIDDEFFNVDTDWITDPIPPPLPLPSHELAPPSQASYIEKANPFDWDRKNQSNQIEHTDSFDWDKNDKNQSKSAPPSETINWFNVLASSEDLTDLIDFSPPEPTDSPWKIHSAPLPKLSSLTMHSTPLPSVLPQNSTTKDRGPLQSFPNDDFQPLKHNVSTNSFPKHCATIAGPSTLSSKSMADQTLSSKSMTDQTLSSKSMARETVSNKSVAKNNPTLKNRLQDIFIDF